MNETWFAELESKIFTIVKTRMTKKYKEKYPTINFESVDMNKVPTKSPTIYFHEIDNPEMANDLENNTVNMVRENIEIEVYSLKDKAECQKVSAYARVEMKALGFRIVQQSPPMKDDDWWRCIMRFYRPIGSGDVLK